MKNRLVSLVILGVIASPLPVFSEKDAAAKAEVVPATLTLASDTQKAETPAAPAETADLAKRIQAVVANRSPVVEAIVSMAKAGIEQGVIEEFARNTNVPLLRADEILYLHHHGVSSQVITTLIKRSGEVKAEQAQTIKDAQARLAQQQAARAANIAAQNPAPPPVAPAPVYNHYYVNPPPVYTYGYPYAYPIYSYAYTRPFRTHQAPTSQIYPYAQRFQDFQNSHQPYSSLNATIQTPASPSFFASRWVWNGTTGKPVDVR